jgi:hypothetical protein
VVLDGFLADDELGGDLAVGHPGGDESGYGLLSGGEMVLAGVAPGPGAEPAGGGFSLGDFEVGDGVEVGKLADRSVQRGCGGPAFAGLA